MACLNINLDVDGVLANMTGALGYDPHTDITEYNFSNLPKSEIRAIKKHFNTTNFWRTLPLIEGAKEGVAALHEAGHKIVFVTAPTLLNNVSWAWARCMWLEEHFPVACRKENIILTKAKHLIHSDLLFDDKLETIMRVNRISNTLGILFGDYAYNQSDYPCRRVVNWTELLEAVHEFEQCIEVRRNQTPTYASANLLF